MWRLRPRTKNRPQPTPHSNPPHKNPSSGGAEEGGKGQQYECGQGRIRTADTRLFRPLLYLLSYLTDVGSQTQCELDDPGLSFTAPQTYPARRRVSMPVIRFHDEFNGRPAGHRSRRSIRERPRRLVLQEEGKPETE